MKLQVYALIFFRINSLLKKAHYLKKLVTFLCKDLWQKMLNYFSVNISDVIENTLFKMWDTKDTVTNMSVTFSYISTFWLEAVELVVSDWLFSRLKQILKSSLEDGGQCEEAAEHLVLSWVRERYRRLDNMCTIVCWWITLQNKNLVLSSLMLSLFWISVSIHKQKIRRQNV